MSTAPAIHIGSAPDSWGVWFADDPEQTPADRFLSEVAASGFEWIELGPYGYLPTDPAELKDKLEQHRLRVSAGTVFSALHRPDSWDAVWKQVTDVAALTRAVGGEHIVVIPDLYRDHKTGEDIESRTLTDEQWTRLTTGTNELGRRILEEYGLQVQFHSHADSHVGHQREIERFVEATDPAYVNLCLDTGHVAYYGGDNLEIIKKYPERIGYLHLKQVDPDIVKQVEAEDLDFPEAVRRGVMCEPPGGLPEMGPVLDAVGALGRDIYAIVEQDMYPCAPDKPLPIARRTHTFLAGCSSARVSIGTQTGGPGMKLALDPQMYYSTSSVLDLPDHVARNGYAWMELSPKDDFIPFFRHPRADSATVAALKKRASDAGVGIASVLPVLRWSGPDEDERRAAVRAWKRAIQITVDLGVETMTSEFNGRPESPEHAEAQFLKSMDELIPVFEKEGIKLALEPHPDDFIEDGIAAVNLVRGFDLDWITFLYCTPHTFHQGNDATGIIGHAGDRVTYVHLADTLNHTASNGLRYIVNPPGSTARVHQHAEMGRGEVDFDEVFQALSDVGFDGTLSSSVFGWEETADEVNESQLDKALVLVEKYFGGETSSSLLPQA